MDVSDFSFLPPDENSNISTSHNQVAAKANLEEHETILISSDEESVIEILTTRHDISSIFKTITESSYNSIKSKLNYKPPPAITVKHNNNSIISDKENQYVPNNKKQKLSSSFSSSSTKQLTLDSFTTNNNKKSL